MTEEVWRVFFDSYAAQYMDEPFTADSVREVEFLDEWEMMVVMRKPAR